MGLFDRLRRSDPTTEPYHYPLHRTQQRTFPRDFTGDLYIWDIDETYLSTDVDTVRGLLAVPLDLAVDKRNVAGTDVLLRALRRGPDPEGPVRSNPLYFVSASPPQLRRVIEKKMVLDGVEFDGITFKDQLSLLRSGRVSALKHHVAYKLSALLLNRAELPWEVGESAFGDDTESDALIYALYADIVAGRLRGPALANTLRRNGCDDEDCSYVARLAGNLDSKELMEAIYIHLRKRTPPSDFHAFGPRVVPCYDTLQMALHLLERGRLSDGQVLELAGTLVTSDGRSPTGIARSCFEFAERGRVRTDTLARLWRDLHRAGLVPRSAAVAEDPEPTLIEPREPGDFVTPANHLDLTTD
ncbi:MAG: hypothetical protein QF464_00130 [Myxococcota bacterium]|nr:hypothetical protein [Myxococcota bacterium]